MKLGVLLIACVALLAPKAHALVDLHLDSNDLTTTAPTSGTSTLVFTGTIDLTDGWTVSQLSVDFPYSTGGDYLPASIDTSFLNWLGSTSNYSGALFDLTISPTSNGLYFLEGGLSNVAQISATGSDPTGAYSFTSSEDFEAHVVPAPEPASMLALGGLGALIIKRRRK